MDTSRQTKEMGLWLMPASKVMKKLQKHCYVWENCLSIRVHHLTVVQLESFWRDGEVSPALQHLFATPGLGQPRKSPVSPETSMISRKVWRLLTPEGTFFQITIEWSQASTWSYEVGNGNEKKKQQRQLFGFQGGFGGILHERSEEREKLITVPCA